MSSQLGPKDARSLRLAPMATLDAQARSEGAKVLTALLAKELTQWEAATSRRKNRRKGRFEKLETAIGAFPARLQHHLDK
jgi:hypothetical protein